MRWHFGHRVSGTSPYRGHEGREAELELDISRRPAFLRFVAGEEEEENGWGERGCNGERARGEEEE